MTRRLNNMRVEGMSGSLPTSSVQDFSPHQAGGESVKSGTQQQEKQSHVQDKNIPNSEKRQVSENEVIDAIEKANKAIEGTNNYVKYSIHEKTHQIMVKIINKETDEVIKELPPEKILDMVANMLELAGLVVDEKR